MNALILLVVCFITGTAHAQVTVQTKEYHEVNLPRLAVNPYPANHWDKKRANIQPPQRTIVVVPGTQVIPTVPLTDQDKEIIRLIK